jgi:uncharacterized membrane protein
MKPLFVLLVIFIVATLATKIIGGNFDFALSARIALSVMLLFTAIGHFAFTKGMTMMIPDFIPFKKEIVYITGIIEIVAAICLLIPSVQVATGWFLILFFVLLLPANINAAIQRIDYQKGTTNGSGPAYLWFRIPLQILFIIWVYLSSIRCCG